ncbi:filamentous hemagglutinin N-terminal domain-containing protein [Enterobacteriaceae bacterium H4N4]|uniref:Filamentous hemagglutinin N-terminal domain-containing protein n=1 Tax=Silvania confinis TaxID=2926470 RepID=A0A9J6QLI5_9ENTR|nr:filamentous hemagglutinin N-terminal domain-containing protein [Silvania confinis]MCU6669133.1 filamentous hemagglutinin N-terminal domain-containing protein [Silvania confinis]
MKNRENKYGSIKLNPIAASLLLLMPVMAQATDISIINGSVTAAANGVNVVNIKEANSNGLSHNIYESLNVSKEGLIFNNSSSATNTVLGGQIAANPNLAGGTAKVILNEVTSLNASTLNGLMEVAGDSAHLIIANPNGITTQGGGFINAKKATLTTGTSTVRDGALSGYSVNGGTITVAGLQSESPTEILARSVKVIGAIEVSELSIVAGNNNIDANGKVTSQAMASGNASSYGVDVSRLGGMYADRISLISTESGMGVRNEGTIAGGEGGVKIASNGRLINNSATIKSSGGIDINTNGSLSNVAGKITSGKKIAIETAKNVITNTSGGSITSAADAYITSGALNNTNGKLAAGATLAVNTNQQKLTNSGKGKNAGIEAGIVALETGVFENKNGQINGYYVGMKNTALNNNAGVIDAYQNIDMESVGNIENQNGLIRSNTGAIKIKTTKAVYNNGTQSAGNAGSDALGIIAGNGINVSADYIFNNAGKIASSNNILLETTKDIDNYQGKIESSQNLSIKGRSMQTSQSGINGVKGVNIELSDTFNSRIGIVTSTEGDVSIKAKKVSNDSSMVLGKNISIQSDTDVDNKYSLIVADEKLAINAGGHVNTSGGNMFGYNAGQYFGFANQLGGLVGGTGVEITAKSLNSDDSRIVAETGNLKIDVNGDMISNNSQIAANAGSMAIKANKVSGNYSTIYAADDLSIDANWLSLKGNGSIANNTAKGIIASDKNILINIKGDYHNDGWISGKGDVTVKTSGILNNNHTISADGNLNVNSQSVINNKDMAAKNNLSIISENDVSSSLGSNMSGYTTNVKAKNITNYGNIVGDSQLTVNVSNNVYNYSNLFSSGKAVINAEKIVNTGFWAVVGGAQGFQSNAYIANIFGNVVGR